MYKLSSKASADLDSILDYSMVNFGENAMIKYHQSLTNCLEILVTNPKVGLEVDYIRADYLCFQHRSHLIFYQITNFGILVVRILHSSMNVSEQFN